MTTTGSDPTRPEGLDGGDDELAGLVASWNEEHPDRPVAENPEARRKIAAAREWLAARVGGHPEWGARVAPPGPRPDDDLVPDPHADPDSPDVVADDDLGDVSALGWRAKRKAWRSTERQRRREAKKSVRFPILTRSIMLWWLIFALLGLVGGGVAAYFWSDFNAEVESLRAENAGLQAVIEQAKADIESQRAQTLDQINQALGPLEAYADEGIKTAEAVGLDPNSIWMVNTLDAEGRPLVGSAFVVASDDQQSLLVTSFSVVRESTIAPGPEVKVRTQAEEQVAEVWSWDESQDLALLVIKRPGLPAIEWISEDEAAAALGKPIFVVGGLGGAGITAVPGLVVDQSGVGIQHNAAVGTAYQGGPIVTPGGKLLAVASLNYAPLGFNPGEVRFAPSIGAACRGVLACGGGVRTQGVEGPAGTDPNAAPQTTD
jgi:S1-C subfamily serine protease